MKLVTLDSVLTFHRGITFKPDDKVEVGSGNSVVCLRTKNIQKELDERDLLAVPTTFVKRDELYVNQGDILISTANSWELVGKCVRVVKTQYKSTIGGFISMLRPKTGLIDPDYLFRFLSMDVTQDRIRHLGKKTTNISNLDRVRFLQLEIPLPPLETQKQIAAVLEKADQLRKDCQQMEQELNSLAQSVFIDMFGDPVTNPKGWETESLDTIAKVQIGPFGSQLHKEDYIADGIPLINPTHIVKGQIVPDMNLTLTPEKFETLPNYHLQTGDIIMGRRGEMGRTALIDECSQGWFCGTGSLYIRITSQLVQPAFLNSVMSCSSMKTWLEEQSLGATMPNLNKKILHSIQVPIPTTAVQKNYALALDVLCKQRQEQKEHIKELDGLFNALMQKAFKGELNL
ncbi:restriction endonuclease subunit S [Vibrio cyclitrophicus]